MNRVISKSITYQELGYFLQNNLVVLDSENGPKVIKLNNSNYFKIFRLKRWLSSALFKHYADRFVANYFKLLKLQIATVNVVGIYILPRNFVKESRYTKAVEYRPLPGETVRDLIVGANFSSRVIEFAKFIARLHDLGVYFRSIHFANIIYNSDIDNHFGLIDIENIKFYNKPLTIRQMKRNFSHMVRYEVDKNWLIKHREIFWRHYVANRLHQDGLGDLTSGFLLDI